MLRKEWLIRSLVLFLGIVIGTGGYALAATSKEGALGLTGLWTAKNAQPVSGVPVSTEMDSPIGNNTAGESNPQNSTPYAPPAAANTGVAPYPPSDTPLTSILPGQNDFSSKAHEGIAGGHPPGIPQPKNGVSNELAQKIIGDYKQDLAIFFEAWKSRDMVAFRSALAKAYKGDLFEKHARQAEQFIIRGVGLEISEIHFDQVIVESADNSSATLMAKYHYVAQDYNIGDQATEGLKTAHDVKVRVNLVKENTRWIITGETLIP